MDGPKVCWQGTCSVVMGEGSRGLTGYGNGSVGQGCYVVSFSLNTEEEGAFCLVGRVRSVLLGQILPFRCFGAGGA